MNFKIISTLCLFLYVINEGFAQFSLDGEIRPRTEYRHGYNNLIMKDQDPGFGISTRARMNFGYTQESYSFYLSVQDVLVWGENKQTFPQDLNNSFAVFQAWAKVRLNDNVNVKLGRQVLSYDDQRILGGLDWAQQGRNHDALLIQYKKEAIWIDIALAYNQDYDHISGFQSVGNSYLTKGFFSYKTMIYGHLKKEWDALSASFLLMNNGFQEFEPDGSTADGISNLQTFGSHLNFDKKNVTLAANIYFQTGYRQGEVDIKGAFLTSLDTYYQLKNSIRLGLGGEVISGNDQEAGSTGAFFPLYGTNHKFNGYMDYFYVGNHANSIGLMDVHGSVNFNLSKKSSLTIKVLGFWGEQKLPSGAQYLGTEIDLVYGVKLKGFDFKAGYSHMFAADGMYELKGISEAFASTTQNWAWAMLIFKPDFLKKK